MRSSSIAGYHMRALFPGWRGCGYIGECIMRLLYVIPAERFGGAERQAVYHMGHLPKWGIDVVPLVGPGTIILEQMAREGIDSAEFCSHMLREYGRPYSTFAFSRHAASTVYAWLWSQQALHRAVAHHSVDAILVGRVTGWATVGLMARAMGLPQLWRAGARTSRATTRPLLRWYAAASRPDALVCNCRAVQRDMGPLVGAPSWIVYNGVDTRRFNPRAEKPTLRSQLELDESAKPLVVGVSARPAPGKGFETLAEALRHLSMPASALRVLIAGDYGWRDHYEKTFTERGLGDQVSFIGHIAHIETFLRSCDAVVLSSDRLSSEGLPNALLEAMAMERAVIGTRAGGISEAIHDGDTGLLVPSGNPCALAAAIAQLRDSPRLRTKLGQRARRSIEQRFSLDASVERLAEGIVNVVENHRNGKKDSGPSP